MVLLHLSIRGGGGYGTGPRATTVSEAPTPGKLFKSWCKIVELICCEQSCLLFYKIILKFNFVDLLSVAMIYITC